MLVILHQVRSLIAIEGRLKRALQIPIGAESERSLPSRILVLSDISAILTNSLLLAQVLGGSRLRNPTLSPYGFGFLAKICHVR